jgi:F0F1-type ATP synthase assembly protein I
MNLSGVQTLAVASQLAVVLAACVLIGIFAGSFLDARLGTSPLFLLLGSILGTAAGIYSMWKTTTIMLDRFERKNQSGTER